MLTPQRAYTLLVVGVNNPYLPPPFRPAAVLRALRFAWLLEGAAQHFSGQLPYLRLAISRRLRERPVTFPPGPRDAPLLAGAIFDLLDRERGTSACVELALDDDSSDPRAALETAFGRGLHELARRWREHLEELARLPAGEPAG
jgi:hypothetical protein